MKSNPKDKPTLNTRAAYSLKKQHRERYVFINHLGVLIDWKPKPGEDAACVLSKLKKYGLAFDSWEAEDLIRACNSYTRRNVPAPEFKSKLGYSGDDYELAPRAPYRHPHTPFKSMRGVR